MPNLLTIDDYAISANNPSGSSNIHCI